MADIFDQTRPDGDKELNENDDELQENNRALVVSVNKEHDFNQGGTQSGRHKFGRGNTAARNAIGEWVAGSVWINTDRDSGTPKKNLWDFYDGSAWVEQRPVFRDQANDFTKGQYGTYQTITSAGGLLPMNWNNGNALKHTLTENTVLQNPSGEMTGVADKFMSCMLWVSQPGAGGPFTLGFGTKYVGGFDGRILAIDPGASKVSLIYMTLLPSDFILVNVIPSLVAVP